MDFQDNIGTSAPNEPGHGGYTAGQHQPPIVITQPKKGRFRRALFGFLFTLSVLANIFLFLAVIGLSAIFVAGQGDIVTEHVIRRGPRETKIAVVNIRGMIDGEMAHDVLAQLSKAAEDKSVKGIILRVNSPGGTIWGSDRIYNEVLKLKEQTEKPVVTLMESLAASGGYYISVAGDTIVAEPTTITGSIGVVMGFLVFEELLEEKLGIQPIVVKSGEKKDWPSYFKQPDKKQLDYLNDKIIQPAYMRFMQIVADGREDLTLEQVEQLSDGSIYSADEALAKNMIDSIGYFDEALARVMDMANVSEAQVVEYRRPFSLFGAFGAQMSKLPKLDKSTLYEFSTPDVLYLWSIH